MANASKQQNSRIFLSKNESDNAKAPLIKGFMTLTQADIEYLTTAEPDDYGTVKMQVSIWADKETKGKYSGNVEQPFKKAAATSKPKAKPYTATDDDF